MNTPKKVAAQVAAVTVLAAVSSVVACTQNEADPASTPIGAGGTTVLPMGGSGGANAAGSNAGGSGGSSAGGGGSKVMGDACAMSAECTAGLQCLEMKCACPGFAPTYCEADAKCSAPMKDPDHCGNCETKCGEQAACTAGMCTPAFMNVAEVPDCGTLKLVLSGTNIYTLSTMSGALSSIPVAGGAPMPIATGLTGATAFAVDATNAYVAAGMSIQRVPLAGGAPAAVVTETTVIHDVAVGGTTLYYGTGIEVKSIAATAANGTPPAMTIALAASQGEPQGVTVSGDILLYGSASAMNVERCDTTMDCQAGAGTDVESRGVGHFKIGQSQGGLIFGHRSIQTDGTMVYWVNNGLQGAPIMPDAGGLYPAKGTGTKDGGIITAFAITPAAGYYADADGNLQQAKVGDAEPVWLGRQLGMVSSMVADATSLYLASGCNVLKAAL